MFEKSQNRKQRQGVRFRNGKGLYTFFYVPENLPHKLYGRKTHFFVVAEAKDGIMMHVLCMIFMAGCARVFMGEGAGTDGCAGGTGGGKMGSEKVRIGSVCGSGGTEKRGRKTPAGKGRLAAAMLAGIMVFTGCSTGQPKGYREYKVQMEQYYVEYSEEYDYWDVLTVEYPRLEGIAEPVQESVNELMYDTAMDRVNYWHLFPNEDVKKFQEEQYSIFCSDVSCDVTFHSQYLVSMDFFEYYSAGNPVWMTNGTERALTVDLLTGESYELEDILEINRDFIKEWDRINSEQKGEEAADDETLDIILAWFLQEDEEMNEIYQCRPFFYVTEGKEFVIGISLDPVLSQVVTYEPVSRNIYTYMDMEALEPYKTESEFWDRLDKSETAGEVAPCVDKHEIGRAHV